MHNIHVVVCVNCSDVAVGSAAVLEGDVILVNDDILLGNYVLPEFLWSNHLCGS